MDREASDKERVKETSSFVLFSYHYVVFCLISKPRVLLRCIIYLFTPKVKELPTFKDMDFRNNMQKVYVTEEEKEKFMEKLNRDVEVGERSCCCCCCFSPLPHSGSISPLRLLL